MKGRWIKYSDVELNYIEAHCTLPRKELHRLFIKRFGRVVSKVALCTLCKRMNCRTGRSGRYEKGNIPLPNARPKGPNKTSFRTGNRPHNWMPVNSTRVQKDGYLEIKTREPNIWERAHILLWKKHNRRIPSGYCVCFVDGNKRNISMNNLELISHNVNLQINKLGFSIYPSEIRPIVRTLGKLIALNHEKTKC